MLLDLKAHYLDLLVSALEEAGSACLHRPDPQGRDGYGLLYVCRADSHEHKRPARPCASTTRSEFVVGYAFSAEGFSLAIEFRDGRKPFEFKCAYQDGLDNLWSVLTRKLFENRIEHKGA